MSGLKLIREHVKLYGEYKDKGVEIDDYINERLGLDSISFDYVKDVRKLKRREKDGFQKLYKEY